MDVFELGYLHCFDRESKANGNPRSIRRVGRPSTQQFGKAVRTRLFQYLLPFCTYTSNAASITFQLFQLLRIISSAFSFSAFISCSHPSAHTNRMDQKLSQVPKCQVGSLTTPLQRDRLRNGYCLYPSQPSRHRSIEEWSKEPTWNFDTWDISITADLE
jgi:hypothetical protein